MSLATRLRVLMHHEPIIVWSCIIGAVGLALPVVVPPIRCEREGGRRWRAAAGRGLEGGAPSRSRGALAHRRRRCPPTSCTQGGDGVQRAHAQAPPACAHAHRAGQAVTRAEQQRKGAQAVALGTCLQRPFANI